MPSDLPGNTDRIPDRPDLEIERVTNKQGASPNESLKTNSLFFLADGTSWIDGDIDPMMITGEIDLSVDPGAVLAGNPGFDFLLSGPADGSFRLIPVPAPLALMVSGLVGFGSLRHRPLARSKGAQSCRTT